VGFVMPKSYGNAWESPLPFFPSLTGDDQERLELFSIFPNTLLLLESAYQQVIVLRPRGPDVTDEIFSNYLATDASQAVELDVAKKEVDVFLNEINQQDSVLLEGLQDSRSMEMGGETMSSNDWDKTPFRFQRIWIKKLLESR
jgi:hypothetical protein